MHLAYTTVATSLQSLLSVFNVGPSVKIGVGVAIIFPVSVVLISINYAAVYANQVQFYVGLGVVTTFLACISRTALIGPSRRLIGIMVYEVTSLILIMIAGATSQSELVGVRYSVQSDPVFYDFYHGIWHLLIPTVFSIMHHRLYMVTVDSKHLDFVVVGIPWCSGLCWHVFPVDQQAGMAGTPGTKLKGRAWD